jgi:UDP-N-acetylmuramoyl-L-alanyl-D-glutamate--2,6-diaminopimelate ligase
MGEVVGQLADVAVVTSDNPRNEDPEEIIRAVLAGEGEARAEVIVEVDRRAAIRRALATAGTGDILLVAGKGHETWQLSRDSRQPFDDRVVVREEAR